MTIFFRNTVVTIGLTIGFLLFAACSASAFLLFTSHLPTNTDLHNRLITHTAISFFFLFFAIAYGIIFRTYFSKTLSPEMFFFTIFILTFSFESLRIIMAFIQQRGYPFFFGMLVTRMLYFGRFMRFFSIFVSGLFASSMTNPKTGIFVGAGALLSLVFATGIPIDSTKIEPDFFYHLGNHRYIFIIFTIAEGIAVLNYMLASFLKSTREYLLLALGILFVLGGSGLTLSIPGNIFTSVSGMILFCLGTILFSRRTHELYLWS